MTRISRFVFFAGVAKKTGEIKSSDPVVTNEISLVVPVKDNQQGVNTYIQRFFATHKIPDYPKEIIFVDNNSAVPLVIAQEFFDRELPIVLVQCRKPGPAAARNRGVEHAKGKWILFNDSDCLPTSGLLKGYVIASNGSVAYAGNVKALGKGKLSQYYESQEILVPLKTRNEQGVFVPQYLITANALVWKETFMEVGGFNEDFPFAAGEDVDLGLRLSQIGNLSYAFESVVEHNFSDSWREFYKRFIRYGKGNKILAKKWNTNLSPRLFLPNKASPFNHLAAKIQYLCLWLGYLSN